MGDKLPANWALCSFMEMFDIQGGTQPPKSEFIFEENPDYVRLLQIRDFGEKPIATYIPFKPSLKFCKKDDVLIGRYGASIGRICSDGEGAYNVALVKVIIPRLINKRFVFFLLKSNFFQEPILKIERSAQDGFNKDDLRQVILPICSLNEQLRIVAKLEKLLAKVDACKERLEKIPAILKRFRQSVLAAACSGRLTNDWRQANKISRSAKDLLNEIQERRAAFLKSEIQGGNRETKRAQTKLDKQNYEKPDDNIPDTWMWTSLLSICWQVVDCHNKTAPYEEQGIPLVRTTNVRNGRLNSEDLKYVSEKTYAYWARRCPPEPGDILFTREAPMGESAIIPPGMKICMGQRMMLLRFFHDLVEIKYFAYALRDYSFRLRLEYLGIGSGVKHLRVGDVEALTVPVPPLVEQHEIVRRVEALFKIADDIEKRYEKAKLHVDKLTQSILAKAFRGDLVPQDPSDEPASELLKRIQEERKNQKAEARPNRKSTSRRVKN
jgi:type I restriction enzyme, S subunit